MLRRCKRGAARDRGARNKAPEVDKARRGLRCERVRDGLDAERCGIIETHQRGHQDQGGQEVRSTQVKEEQDGPEGPMVPQGYWLACAKGPHVNQCPNRASKDLLQKVNVANPNSPALCLVKGGFKEKANKGQIVKAWSTEG